MLDLKYCILPGKFMPPGLELEYQRAYETFQSCWGEAFRELFGPDYVLYSNDFTRQDYIHTLFAGDKCIALACLREIDLRNPADLDDSWFKPWKRSHLTNFARAGHRRCLVDSYFTVHKDYRRSALPGQESVGHILGCLTVLYQLDLGVPLMFGMTRNDRSMNKLTARWGTEVVETNIIHNNTPTDLIVFTTEKIRAAMKTFPPIVFDLYQNKRDYYAQGAQHARAA